MPRYRRRVRRLWRSGTLAGLLVGAVLCLVLVGTGTLGVPRRLDPRDASADFLAAWERSRRAPLLVEGEFRREQPGGRVLTSGTQLVQRWPDRLVRQFGSTTGTVGGREVNCSTDANGNYGCAEQGEPVADPDGAAEAALADELRILRDYFTKPGPPLYLVNRRGACFELRQRILYPDPPYGEWARFCFDDRTGALRVFERRLRDGTTESSRATSIRTDVTANDFSMERQPGFDSAMQLPAPIAPTPTSTPPSDVTLLPGETGTSLP